MGVTIEMDGMYKIDFCEVVEINSAMNGANIEIKGVFDVSTVEVDT